MPTTCAVYYPIVSISYAQARASPIVVFDQALSLKRLANYTVPTYGTRTRKNTPFCDKDGPRSKGEGYVTKNYGCNLGPLQRV